MNLLKLGMGFCAGMTPVTGDRVRPWLAAVILIVSIVVLVTLILVSRRSNDKDRDDTYQDEDDPDA